VSYTDFTFTDFYRLYFYCTEGIEMRQLAFRSTDFYCQNIKNLKFTLALFLYSNGKKGKQANSERDRERASASVGALRKEGHCHPSPTDEFLG
jgi:hypothetical protein